MFMVVGLVYTISVKMFECWCIVLCILCLLLCTPPFLFCPLLFFFFLETIVSILWWGCYRQV